MQSFALRAGRPAPRAYLALECLSARLTPAAPQIVDLSLTTVGGGWYMISGQVIADSPEGMTVEFTSPSDTIQGQRAEVESDGGFALLLTLQTDGSDMGTVTATTQGWDGVYSDPAYLRVDPI